MTVVISSQNMVMKFDVTFPRLPRSERYVMRAVERETFFGRESLDQFDEGIVDCWYARLWGQLP